MKIVPSPKDGRNVEQICIWDGPFINEVLYVPPGRDRMSFAVTGENEPLSHACYLTDSAFERNVPSYFNRLDYERTNREDEEGRVYFAMKQM